MSTQTLRMAEVSIQSQRLESAMKRYLPWVALLLLFGLLFFCPDALAQSTTSDPGAQVTRFFDKIILALRPISIAIGTIAFIFAGYQIAFNHKRIIDVAPILIGAIVIGAAAQLASWFL